MPILSQRRHLAFIDNISFMRKKKSSNQWCEFQHFNFALMKYMIYDISGSINDITKKRIFFSSDSRSRLTLILRALIGQTQTGGDLILRYV
jgi:hypothetical protein